MATSAAAQTPLRQAARIPELDGVRGVAILPVIAIHCALTLCPPGLVRSIVGLGWVGVDLFFVLSGLLITGILLDSKGSPHYFGRFYLRRLFRIFPIYYAYIILFFHVAPAMAHATGKMTSFAYGRADELWYWVYLSNWRDAVLQSRYLRHFWSLSIEEQFYLVWPLVVYIVSKPRLKYVCIMLAIGAMVLRIMGVQMGMSPYTLYGETPFRLEGLALGALLALAGRDPLLRHRLKALMPVAAVAAAIAMMAVFMTAGPDYSTAIMAKYGYAAVAVLCWAFVWTAMQQLGTGRTLARFLRQRWLVRFGAYSYGLYVWHLPIAEQIRIAGTHAEQRLVNPWIVVIASLAVGIGLSCAAARVSWRLIEMPCARVKERLAA